MACFAALFAAGGYAVFYTAKKAVYARIDEKLNIDGYSIMSATYLKSDDSVELHFTVSLLRDFSGDVRIAYYHIRDRDGRTIKRSESLLGNDLPPSIADSRQAKFWNFKLPNGRRARGMGILYGPKERDKAVEAAGAVESLSLVVANDVENEMASLANLRNSLLGVAALIVAFTPVLVVTVLKKGLSPLAKLASKTGGITSDSLAQRFSVDSLPGELKPIATQLNQLLDRLSISFERERTFSADVAHELRTPIAELRNIAEVGLKWKDPELADDYRSSLEIATQMERIVNQLFELMRCESNQIEVSKKQLSLSDLAERIWSPLSEHAEKKGLRIELSIPSEIEIETDPNMLERVVRNLFENAVNYAPPAGEVSIVYLPDTATLSVSNTCSGLEPADLELMFSRFWRKDKARADGDHSGIGLAIALAFAQRLDLSLEARLVEDSRIEFTVSGLTSIG